MSSNTVELSCFAITPIGNKHAVLGTVARDTWEQHIQIWEEVILPACVGVGLTPVRADQISEAGDITDQIFRKLRDAHVVIADLTGANPNVMYELGLRHSTGKLTIQIGEAERLPFDVSTIRTIQFRKTPAGLVEARRNLAEALAAGINGHFTPIAATRVWLEEPSGSALLHQADEENGGISEIGKSDGENEEAGFLEVLAELDGARTEMMASLTASGNVLAEIAACTSKATEQLKSPSGTSVPIQTKIAVSNALAKQLEDPGARLEALAISFANSLKRTDPGTKLIIEEFKKKAADEESQKALKSMLGFFESLLSGLEAAKNYRSVITSGRTPTKAQGKEYRRIARALDIQIAVVPLVESWLQLLGNHSK